MENNRVVIDINVFISADIGQFSYPYKILAIAAKARVIVTGNTNDFSFTEFRGIIIQTPKAFYEEFFSS